MQPLHPLTSAEPLPVSLMGVYNVSERFPILNLSPKYQSVSDDYCIEKKVELFLWHLKTAPLASPLLSSRSRTTQSVWKT